MSPKAIFSSQYCVGHTPLKIRSFIRCLLLRLICAPDRGKYNTTLWTKRCIRFRALCPGNKYTITINRKIQAEGIHTEFLFHFQLNHL